METKLERLIKLENELQAASIDLNIAWTTYLNAYDAIENSLSRIEAVQNEIQDLKLKAHA